jgi:hypothetical protein
VTVTVKVLAVAEEHDSVEVWEAPRTMLLGVRVQVNPAGDTELASATVPVNPFTGATVIVEVAAVVTVVVTAVGLAATVKSWIVNVTVAVWDREPLVPVTVTVKVVAVVEEQDRVEVWLAPRTILVGLRVHVRPAGETDEVRATVPVNPWRGATVIVDVPVAPASAVTLVGLAVTEKSWTVNVTVAERVGLVPLVPVTVTV